MYENAEGDSPDEKINAMRRAQYQEKKGEISAQKREAYRARKVLEEEGTKKITVGDSTRGEKRDKMGTEKLTPTSPISGQLYEPHPLKVDNSQFGAKIGKHAQDYGMDPSAESTREFFRNEISRIVNDADERRYGDWRGQEYPVIFHIKGNDVVVESKDGEFITILKGGISNARVKNAGE